VRAAPTGFSAVITPDGRIVERSSISEQRVIQQTIQRRAGLTIATRVGDWLAFGVAIALIAIGWALHLQQHRDRPVVDEGDLHLGAEPARGDGGAELAQPLRDEVDEGLGVLGPRGRDPRGPAPP